VGGSFPEKGEDSIPQFRKYVAASRAIFLLRISRKGPDLAAFKVQLGKRI
jgi:hypothetical protein